jgi:hypothetical protein
MYPSYFASISICLLTARSAMAGTLRTGRVVAAISALEELKRVTGFGSAVVQPYEGVATLATGKIRRKRTADAASIRRTFPAIARTDLP